MQEHDTRGTASLHCVIHTPLSYLCLREFVISSSYRACHLHVLATSRAAHDAVVALQGDFPWTTIAPLSPGLGQRKRDRFLAPLDLLRTRWRLGKLVRRIGRNDDIVVSHLNNPFTRFVINRTRGKVRRFVAVDDGTATLAEFGALTRKGALTAADYTGRNTGWKARLQRLLFSEEPVFAKDVEYFSFWPLGDVATENSPAIIGKNEFRHLGAARPAAPPAQQAFVIGQPFVRRGQLDKAAYERILRSVHDHYREQGIVPVYFPHRNEAENSIPADFEIRRVDKPFEIYLTDLQMLPKFVSGFYSTCLITTKYIFRDALQHELFWGFPELSPEISVSEDISRMMRRESERWPGFTINTRLGRD